MEKEIVVLDADKKQCQEICSYLDGVNYQATPIYSFKDLPEFIQEGQCKLLILDLDTVEADKALFRKIKRSKPSLRIVGLSSQSFHPDLEEAMSSSISACLSKPVDEEELLFWVKSIF